MLPLLTVFAWEAYDRGSEVHLQADPTKLELLHKSFKVKKEEFKEKQGDSILKKVRTCRFEFSMGAYVLVLADFTNVCASKCHNQYGGEEHLNAPPRELLLAQTEDYMEYSRHGAVLKGLEKAVVRSKYEEDVLINNHTVRAQ